MVNRQTAKAAEHARPRQTMGMAGEDLALDYLQARGLSLIERNFRLRRGEIDLIMQDQTEVVFVEVRVRRAGIHGGGLESITRGKRQRLVAAAAGWLQRRGQEPATRFDVIAIDPNGTIQWQRDAFRADD